MNLIINFLTIFLIFFLSNEKYITRYSDIEYLNYSKNFVIIILSILGSLISFLKFNFYPGLIIMGDTGSLPLGAVFGFIIIILKQKFNLLLLSFFFILETVSVIIQVFFFKNYKKRIFLCLQYIIIMKLMA